MKKLITVTTFLCVISAAALANSGMRTVYLEHAASTLPHAKAENFLNEIENAHETNKPLYEQARELRAEMRQILTASTFDKDAFAAKSQELRQLREEIASNMDDAFINAASELSPGERMRLANGLEREHQKKQAAKKTQH